jgi:hypothetical protein
VGSDDDIASQLLGWVLTTGWPVTQYSELGVYAFPFPFALAFPLDPLASFAGLHKHES